MKSHDYYEQLCSLAAAGQLSSDEWAELSEHLKTCQGCKDLAYDCGQIGFQILPLIADQHSRVPLPAGLVERVIARTKLHAESPKNRGNNAVPIRKIWNRVAQYSVLAVLLALTIIGTRYYDSRVQRDSRNHAGALAERGADSSATGLPAEADRLQQESMKARERERFTADQLRKLQAKLESAMSQKDDLESQLASIKQTFSTLHDKEAQGDAERARLQHDLEQLRADLETRRDALARKDREVLGLRTEVQELSARRTDQVQRNSALRRATELVADRNVHFWNVTERNENGRVEKAFGRIFYVEGKGLVFFAYDLADRNKGNARLSYYLWGENSRTKDSVKNLGMFQTESEVGGWALNCDDPVALANIDRVFVTAEADQKDATKPKGKKILIAALDPETNQP